MERRTAADGKGRHTATGSSTSKSSFPIPEAPEHSSQLGDMKVVFVEPIWTVKLAEEKKQQYFNWLGNV